MIKWQKIFITVKKPWNLYLLDSCRPCVSPWNRLEMLSRDCKECNTQNVYTNYAFLDKDKFNVTSCEEVYSYTLWELWKCSAVCYNGIEYNECYKIQTWVTSTCVQCQISKSKVRCNRRTWNLSGTSACKYERNSNYYSATAQVLYTFICRAFSNNF